ncbi:hypothetical protein BBK82_42295 [Lentzea guizhouensis]|uniref:Uncharacterized protein n=2 Tax=Lentzea guizhouensis TaxID=1586287 RepID=A0A1B2HV90_9PSEU|nr:hypothetical protein BBK82_42295 [Lentzea guizhouensis]
MTLVEALDRAGVPRAMYEIEGVREFGAVLPTDFYFLRVRGGRWQVGVYERGEYDPVEEYDTEGEATAAFHRRLMAT